MENTTRYSDEEIFNILKKDIEQDSYGLNARLFLEDISSLKFADSTLSLDNLEVLSEHFLTEIRDKKERKEKLERFFKNEKYAEKIIYLARIIHASKFQRSEEFKEKIETLYKLKNKIRTLNNQDLAKVKDMFKTIVDLDSKLIHKNEENIDTKLGKKFYELALVLYPHNPEKNAEKMQDVLLNAKLSFGHGLAIMYTDELKHFVDNEYNKRSLDNKQLKKVSQKSWDDIIIHENSNDDLTTTASKQTKLNKEQINTDNNKENIIKENITFSNSRDLNNDSSISKIEQLKNNRSQEKIKLKGGNYF